MDKFFEGYTLGIEVIKHEESNYSKLGDGYAIYYKILNQTSKKATIVVSDVYKVSKDNAQFTAESWLVGYGITNATSIMSGAYKTAATIHSNAVSGNINTKDRVGIVVKDLTNGFEYDALFILGDNDGWSLLSCDVNEQEKIPEKRTVETKLKKSIERLEVFEEKLGVRLDNISIKTNSEFGNLTIIGEIFSVTGDKIPHDININVNLYDRDNDILGTQSDYFSKENFMGYNTFEINFYDDRIGLTTNKVRVYVSKC